MISLYNLSSAGNAAWALNKFLLIIGKHDTGFCHCGRPEAVMDAFLECSR